jgi:hypothetical protein
VKPASHILVAIAASFLCGGCLFFAKETEVERNPRAGTPYLAESGLKEYRVALHVHCYLSHDSDGRIEDISLAAREHGFDTVILSDHYEEGNIEKAPRGVIDGVLFIPGVEERVAGGSILSFPLRRDYDPKLRGDALLAELTRQNPINVLAHIEEIENWDMEPFQAIEIFNIHAAFTEVSPFRVVGSLIASPPQEFFEEFMDPLEGNFEIWDRELARGRRLAPMAGHDAHDNVNILGTIVGTYSQLLRLVSTRILAEEWTPAALTDAIRKGRTFVVFDYLGGGTGFSMTYGSEEEPPGKRATFGDEPVFGDDKVLELRVPDSASPFEVSILRNGVRILRTDGARFTMTLPGEGVYRAEVRKGRKMWIISGVIRVKPRAGNEGRQP